MAEIPQISDERLEALMISREDWTAMRAESAEREKRVPQVGDQGSGIPHSVFRIAGHAVSAATNLRQGRLRFRCRSMDLAKRRGTVAQHRSDVARTVGKRSSEAGNIT